MIITAGDSFVYGSELADCRNAPSKHTFAALLAEDAECIAWPGYANDSIARTTIERCESGPVAGVFVMWSFPGRYEFRFAYDTKQRTHHWHAITPWTGQEVEDISHEFNTENKQILVDYNVAVHRAKQTGVAEFAETFYRHVGSTEYWEVYSSLKEIVYLQNYLKLKNIPYMFACADNSVIYNYTTGQTDSVINSLSGQIDLSNWFWFPPGQYPHETQKPRGFYQWAVENKYRIGTTHPLEEAHRDAAQLMQGKFNELVKKHL